MMLRKVSLACGILASFLYVGATILGAMQWKGYDWTTRSVSELFALDAPSRHVVATAFLIYGVLMIVFGAGVWMSAGDKRALRIAGALLAGYGLAGEPGPLFFSMHTMERGAKEMAQSDIMHIILTAALVLLILLSIGFGATAFGGYFRLYSIATILVVVVFGALAGLQSGNMSANLPTPWMGVEERLNIFAFMLWVVALGVGLLRVQDARATQKQKKPTATQRMTFNPAQRRREPVASHRASDS